VTFGYEARKYYLNLRSDEERLLAPIRQVIEQCEMKRDNGFNRGYEAIEIATTRRLCFIGPHLLRGR